jgi:hypothetical protein
MKKIEQINTNGQVVIDYDYKLSKKDIKNILSKYVYVSNDENPFICIFNNKKINLCIKQVTYLGNPHNIFKKRIQIPKEWKKILSHDDTYLLGIYSFNENNIFVFFDKSRYIKNNLNNSSAHVHTIDLIKSMEYGVFSKKDSRGNSVTAVREDKLFNFIEGLIENKIECLPKEIEVFEAFSSTLEKKWRGIDCFKEMQKYNYKNRNQGEWPGFYLEFKFENFLEWNNKYKQYCLFESKKKNGELDFDLNFNNKYFGDLKTHSTDSGSVLGNDKESFEKAIKIYGKFWYVVFNHDTVTDKDCNFEVAKYWNNYLGKKNLLSYSNRMKNLVTLKTLQILEINKDNFKHISIQTQGKNSNGKQRKLKVQIKNGDIDNFLIFSKDI